MVDETDLKAPPAWRVLLPAMLAVVLAWALFGLSWRAFGEAVRHGAGFGWDGELYGKLAQDFWHILTTQVGGERIQRVAPSTAVAILLAVTGIPKTNANVSWMFAFFDLVVLLLSVPLWAGIANRLRLNAGMAVFGFLALFVNFANAKLIYFYPTQTDTAAFFLGMLALYLFLERRQVLLVLTILLGTFCWSSFALVIGPLLAFPLPEAPPSVSPDADRAGRATLGLTWALTAFVMIGLVRHPLLLLFTDRGDVRADLLPLSFALANLFLYAALRRPVAQALNVGIRQWFRSLSVPSAVVLLAALFWPGIVIALFSRHGQPAENTMGYLAVLVSVRSLYLPAQFLVAHAVWAGPAFLLIVLEWRRIVAKLAEWGLGPVLCAILAVLCALDNETRHLTPLWPLLVTALTSVLNERPAHPALVPTMAVFSFLFAKVWLPINYAPWNWLEYLDFPAQIYYMTFGPWMSTSMYLVQGAVIIPLAALFWWLSRAHGAPSQS